VAGWLIVCCVLHRVVHREILASWGPGLPCCGYGFDWGGRLCVTPGKMEWNTELG
jgi:hypothetical protein